MAWTFKITPINIDRDIVGVSALEDESGITVTSAKADISSPAKKVIVLNTLWAKFQKALLDKAKREAMAVKIAAMEAAAATNFEGRM